MALSDNVIAAYKFSNGALTTDSVGSYTLTNNNTVANSNDGKPAYCADAGSANTNKSLTRDDAYGMLGSTAKTYAFWGKVITAPTSGNSMMFFRHLYGGSAVGNYANILYSNDGGTLRVKMPTSPAGMSVDYTLTVDTWYHFVVTVPANNTGNITCYINGSSIGTTGNWSQNYALTTRMAMFTDHAFSSYGSMKMDEFYIWNRVLSGAEITELYNGGTDNQYPFSVAYSMVASLGTFTLTGINAGLISARSIIASVGTFTLTGIDALFALGKGIVANAGAFALTGYDVTLSTARTMIASVGTFTLTGIDATFSTVKSIIASVGTFILTGYDAIMRRGGWRNTTKETTTWTDQTKETTNWTNRDKSI